MAAKDRINKAGEAARAAQRNQYLQRLLADEELRGSLITAYGAARSAYGRMTNGKPATQALFEDRKLQKELKEAANALRDASSSLREPPKRRRRGGISPGSRRIEHVWQAAARRLPHGSALFPPGNHFQ